jgi:hypothetical protein
MILRLIKHTPRTSARRRNDWNAHGSGREAKDTPRSDENSLASWQMLLTTSIRLTPCREPVGAFHRRRGNLECRDPERSAEIATSN